MFCIGARPRLFGCIRLLFLLNMPQEKEALTREIPVAIKSNPENGKKQNDYGATDASLGFLQERHTYDARIHSINLHICTSAAI